MLVYVMCAVACVVAYLLCGIPSALIVTSRLAHVDVRSIGSGNVGSTNAVRAGGTKAGVFTLLLDVLKAAVSIGVGYALVGYVGAGADFLSVGPGTGYDWCMALVYLFCILGHVFTPYLHFKGGKGIAVGFGGAVILMPAIAPLLLVAFLLFAVSTRFVSLGSIVAAACMPVFAALVYHPTPAFLVVCAVASVLIVWAHRKNIVKLVHGQESKFSFKSKKEA